MSASDADDGSNGEVTYRFETLTNFFSIDEDSGVVTVARSLSGSEAQVHTLVVEARDGGNPRRTASGTCMRRGLHTSRRHCRREVYIVMVNK